MPIYQNAEEVPPDNISMDSADQHQVVGAVQAHGLHISMDYADLHRRVEAVQADGINISTDYTDQHPFDDPDQIQTDDTSTELRATEKSESSISTTETNRTTSLPIFGKRVQFNLAKKVWPEVPDTIFKHRNFPALTKAQEAVRDAPTPRAAFDVARRYDQLKRKDWDDVKDEEMLWAVRAKFVQHKDLADLLRFAHRRRQTRGTPRPMTNTGPTVERLRKESDLDRHSERVRSELHTCALLQQAACTLIKLERIDQQDSIILQHVDEPIIDQPDSILLQHVDEPAIFYMSRSCAAPDFAKLAVTACSHVVENRIDHSRMSAVADHAGSVSAIWFTLLSAIWFTLLSAIWFTLPGNLTGDCPPMPSYCGMNTNKISTQRQVKVFF